MREGTPSAAPEGRASGVDHNSPTPMDVTADATTAEHFRKWHKDDELSGAFQTQDCNGAALPLP
eukprot:184687-Prorocentrum_lima.AAC.1